jgi:integrase
MNRVELTKFLKEKRPKLTENSLKSYTSLLWTLNKNLFDEDKLNIEDLEDTEKVIDYIKTKPLSSYKTILAALYVLTDIEIYRELMMDKIKEYKDDKDKNEMNEKQKKEYMTQEEILTKYKELEEVAKKLYKKRKDKRTDEDKQKIQEYIIMALMSGIFMQPRRLLDFTEIKINNIDKEKDNWIDFKKKKMHYNVYKNSGTKGEDIIDLPDELAKILKKWIRINNNDYLLVNTEGNKLSNVTLHSRLKNITGTGGNMFRHSFLTEKYQGVLELKDNMKKMGSSIANINAYIQS